MFNILDLHYGWFDIKIGEYYLTNSDYLGCDAPKLLLKGLCNILENKTNVEWLCWQDEPGAEILKLERKNDNIIIEIYGTDKESFDLEYSGTSLKDNIKKLTYTIDIDLIKFSKYVCKEFYIYENGNAKEIYEYNWDKFPQKEFDKLKNILKINKLSDFDYWT